MPPEGSASPTSPAPRVEALFAATLKEGWLRENVCTGMMKGMIESVRSGKRTEDECLELSKKKLAGMRKGGEAKRKSKGGAEPEDSPAPAPAPTPAFVPAADSPAPRVEALFAETLKEGWLAEKQCLGMMKGMVETVRSGKKTEDEVLALATAKLAGMRKGGEAKMRKVKRQAQQKQKRQGQQKQAKPRECSNGLSQTLATSDAVAATEIEIRPATQLIQQLSSKDEAAQLDAAEHITAVCFKLRGQEYRDFQDSLKPALQLLTEMVRRPKPRAPP